MGIVDLIPIPSGINPGLKSARQLTMLSLLGGPRGSYTQDCQAIENPRLSPLFETRSVGPFRVSGLAVALDSLAKVFADVRGSEPAVYAALGTAGMLCARFVRGSTSSISNHSWGTAIDLKLNGVLDGRGDGRVLHGLATIAPIFNAQGWYWGAAFHVEDAMHFEVSEQKIREWHASGAFGDGLALPHPALSLGDRGPEVRDLQTLLNAVGHGLRVDGDFGPKTQNAVRAFQRGAGLEGTGIAGEETLAALRGGAPHQPRPGGQF